MITNPLKQIADPSTHSRIASHSKKNLSANETLITLIVTATLGVACYLLKKKEFPQINKAKPLKEPFYERYLNSFNQQVSKLQSDEVKSIFYEISPYTIEEYVFNRWFEALSCYHEEFKEFAVSYLLSKQVVTNDIREKVIAHFCFDKIGGHLKQENLQQTKFYQLLNSFFGMMPAEACRAVGEEIEKIIFYEDQDFTEPLHRECHLMRTGSLIAQFRTHISAMIAKKQSPEKIRRLKKGFAELIVFWINNMDFDHRLLIPLGVERHMVPITIYKTDRGHYSLSVIDTGGGFKALSRHSEKAYKTTQLVFIGNCKKALQTEFWEELLDLKLTSEGEVGMKQLLITVQSSGISVPEVENYYNELLHDHLQRDKTCTISSLISLFHFNMHFVHKCPNTKFESIFNAIQKNIQRTIYHSHLKQGASVLYYHNRLQNQLLVVRKNDLSFQKVLDIFKTVYVDEDEVKKNAVLRTISDIQKLKNDRKWILVTKCLALTMQNENYKKFSLVNNRASFALLRAVSYYRAYALKLQQLKFS